LQEKVFKFEEITECVFEQSCSLDWFLHSTLNWLTDIQPWMDFLFAVGKNTYEYIVKMYIPLMDGMRDLQQFAATQIQS
jgi:hypothetical protein